MRRLENRRIKSLFNVRFFRIRKRTGEGDCFMRVFICGLLVCVMGTMVPVTALAASPDFSRTEEEWSRLQDNVLEYGEIADLIHEYNVTVQNNQYEYRTFIQDYGTTRRDISNQYLTLAYDLEGSISGGDTASEKVSDLQLELQAKSLREQADDNIEDSHTYYLTYCQAEDNLVLSAQSKFIAYYDYQLQLAEAEASRETLEDAYNLTVIKQQAGTATEAEVLDALEAVQSQENTEATLKQQIENTRQSLIVMLGWNGSDSPEISDLPTVDMSTVEAIDLEADQETAVENNYTLQINQRKYDNSQTESKKEDLSKTIEANKKAIRVSVASAYQSLQTTKLSYEQALSDQTAAARDLELAQQKLNAGMITQYEFNEYSVNAESKELAVRRAELDFLLAYETYQWYVNGLASAE
ncbi:MAG: TolC family protein [Clostridiales bacterium]|nr:TolC family protein [Clostridiales bacterium]